MLLYEYVIVLPLCAQSFMPRVWFMRRLRRSTVLVDKVTTKRAEKQIYLHFSERE